MAAVTAESTATTQFMLLICGDETAAEQAGEGCGGWTEEMAARGVLVGGGGLRPPDQGRSVRVRRSQLLLTDGAFAETREQIGGFCVIECDGMDAAIEIAAAHPAASYGTIVIRELWTP